MKGRATEWLGIIQSKGDNPMDAWEKGCGFDEADIFWKQYTEGLFNPIE